VEALLPHKNLYGSSSEVRFGNQNNIAVLHNSGGSMQQGRFYKSGFARLAVVLGICVTLFFSTAQVRAQNKNAGEIRGTVTDTTGAVVQNAQIILTNTATGISTTTKSDPGGVYDVPSLVPGPYSVKFSSPSYKVLVRENILLQVGSITINGVLEAGTVSQQVTVDTETTAQLQTDDSEQNLTLDSQTVTGLPNIGGSWFNETALIPGVNGGSTQNTNGAGVGINGAESYQESFLVNGGTVTLIGSQDVDWLVNATEFVSEANFDTHTFSAASGNGASVFNIITKSGTNRFHGSVYDYNTNATFSARNYFSIGVPPGSSNLIGGTIGGPVLRNKVFFFFGLQRQRSTGQNTGYFTVPRADERGGNLSQELMEGCPSGIQNNPSTAAAICNPNPASGHSDPYPDPNQIYNPATTMMVGGQNIRAPFLDNMIPTGDLNQQALNIQNFFPAPNLSGSANNYYFSQNIFDTTYWWNGKVDYNLNDRHHLNGSFVYGTVNFPSEAPLDPIGEYTEIGKEGAGQISDTWTLSPSKVNEARFALIRVVNNWVGGDFGKNYPQKIGIPNPTSNVFPGISISGAISTSTGPGLNAILAEDSFVPSDVYTWIKGKHILKVGGEFDDYVVNINFGITSDGNYGFSGIATRDPSGVANASNGIGYADFLLGNVSNWSVSLSPETGSRLKSYQLFAQDDYKMTPNLTLNLGVRYQVQPGWTEAQNRLGDFDPNLTNPATGTLGALWFAGNDNRNAVEATQFGLWQPRVGFAWSPRANWAVRGGFGIYDELYGYNTYAGSAGLGITAQNSVSSTNQITPVFNLAQGPPPPIYPTKATLTPELLNNQGISYIPYHTPIPYIEEWQLDVQHELPGGIVADIAYVGSRGINIARASDADQVPSNLIINAASGANMQQFRPYPQYQGIGATTGDGVSNYDSLQLRVQKRYTNGLQFLSNFTYAHTLDDGTGSGYGGPNGIGAPNLWQNGYDPMSSYGNSLLDIPFTFNGDVIYELPVGRGKRFLDHGGIFNAVLGGWVGSGLWQVHSGIPFTPYIGGANLDGSLAGSWFPNRVGSGRLSNPTIHEWFNPAAFQTPAVGTFGNSRRDILFGPSWRQLDLSLTKKWAITKLGDTSDFQLRIDAQDALNNPNFGNPNAAIATSTVGTITGANTSRAIQFTAKVSF
jgi:Carboxypeptidase regulatory-like domain